MKVFALFLLILGLIATGFMSIGLILIVGAGPFLLVMSYCVYIHSLVLTGRGGK